MAKPLTDFQRMVLLGIRTSKFFWRDKGVYIDLRFDGYCFWDGDGEIFLTAEGYAETERNKLTTEQQIKLMDEACNLESKT